MAILAFHKLKKYANQLEWIEGTLLEDYSEEELAQKAVKRLEKAFDLEYFGHACSPAPRHLGQSASSSTVP